THNALIPAGRFLSCLSCSIRCNGPLWGYNRAVRFPPHRRTPVRMINRVGLLIVVGCSTFLSPGKAGAVSRTLKAGEVLGVSENLVLSGDDVLEVRGTAAKPCRIDANGQQIRTTSDWRGRIKVNYCE